MNDIASRLESIAQHWHDIITGATDPLTEYGDDADDMSAFLDDSVLDIQHLLRIETRWAEAPSEDPYAFIFPADREAAPTWAGARVLVACGGPTVWIDTVRQTVDATWGTQRASRDYEHDAIGLREYCEEDY